MRIRLAVVLAAIVAALAFSPARADILIRVDKARQIMTVTVDGEPRYTWNVSTGIADYDTPDGEFQAFRMERDHFSKEWDDAPMPYSIFFTQEGHAIHGTNEVRHLGRPASHGCVRLSKENAAVLWDLVEEQGLKATHVVLTGEIPASNSRVIARRQPSVTYDDNDVAPPPRRKHVRDTRRNYQARPRYYYYSDRPYVYYSDRPYVARRYYDYDRESYSYGR